MMSGKLQKIINAHGGLPNWKKLGSLQCDASIAGFLFTVRGQAKIFEDVTVKVNLNQPFTPPLTL